MALMPKADVSDGLSDGCSLWSALLHERGRAYRVARARGASPQDAEDCAQEALARVAAMPDVDLDRVGPLVGVVASRLAVDVHRRDQRDRGVLQRSDVAQLIHAAPEQAVCDAAEARWLWSRLDGLAPRERQAIELRAGGRTVTEIADALGVTYKAAENVLRRARSRMREVWRSTAALLGVLWGGRARPRDAALLSVPVALVVVLALLSEPATSADGDPQTGAPPLSQVVDGPPTRALPLAPDGATPPARPPVVTSIAPAADPPSLDDVRPVPMVPPVDAGVVRYEGGHFEEIHPEETFAETVERCVREGVVVSVTEVRCRDEAD